MVAVQLEMPKKKMVKRYIFIAPNVILKDTMRKNAWYSMRIQGIISSDSGEARGTDGRISSIIIN